MNSNTFLNDAFNFDTTIQYKSPIIYSSICIFCKNNDSVALIQDGSFRQCLKCRKQFKSEIIEPINNQQKSNSFHKPPPIFQTFTRPLYSPDSKL